MIAIGFGHRSRMGKDTAANITLDILRQRLPKAKIGRANFADKIKQICYDLYRHHGIMPAGYYDQYPEKRNEILPSLGMSPVSLWIKIGTPMFRDSIHVDTWVDYVIHSNRSLDFLVIGDVRFENEISGIRRHGGAVCKIERSSIPLRDSVADNALAHYTDWDWEIKDLSLEATRISLEVFTERYIK